ncbi:MAG: MmcB family DNA repair protein [Pseudomonadota bacterium]
MQDGDLNLVHKAPGQLLARGVCRHLQSLDYACVEEFTPERGKRVDIMALGPKGQIWVIECKSSRADFNADHKWQGYLEWGDRFFWAVNEAFPSGLLPIETGLIIADSYGAEVIRMPDEQKLSPARRKALTQRFARQAALRLQGMRDPQL